MVKIRKPKAKKALVDVNGEPVVVGQVVIAFYAAKPWPSIIYRLRPDKGSVGLYFLPVRYGDNIFNHKTSKISVVHDVEQLEADPKHPDFDEALEMGKHYLECTPEDVAKDVAVRLSEAPIRVFQPVAVTEQKVVEKSRAKAEKRPHIKTIGEKRKAAPGMSSAGFGDPPPSKVVRRQFNASEQLFANAKPFNPKEKVALDVDVFLVNNIKLYGLWPCLIRRVSQASGKVRIEPFPLTGSGSMEVVVSEVRLFDASLIDHYIEFTSSRNKVLTDALKAVKEHMTQKKILPPARKPPEDASAETPTEVEIDVRKMESLSLGGDNQEGPISQADALANDGLQNLQKLKIKACIGLVRERRERICNGDLLKQLDAEKENAQVETPTVEVQHISANLDPPAANTMITYPEICAPLVKNFFEDVWSGFKYSERHAFFMRSIEGCYVSYPAGVHISGQTSGFLDEQVIDDAYVEFSSMLQLSPKIPRLTLLQTARYIVEVMVPEAVKQVIMYKHNLTDEAAVEVMNKAEELVLKRERHIDTDDMQREVSKDLENIRPMPDHAPRPHPVAEEAPAPITRPAPIGSPVKDDNSPPQLSPESNACQ